MRAGVTLINVDESVLRMTDHRTKGWSPSGRRTFNSHSQRLYSINIIATLSSDGEVNFTVNRGRTNFLTFCAFLA